MTDDEFTFMYFYYTDKANACANKAQARFRPITVAAKNQVSLGASVDSLVYDAFMEVEEFVDAN